MTLHGFKWFKARPLSVVLPLLEEWLMRHFPTPYPVNVKYLPNMKYEGQKVLGLCWRRGKKIHIRVRRAGRKGDVVETLLHEWAHAHTMRHDRLENVRARLDRFHDDEFFLAYGRMYRRLYDGDGWEEVRTGL